MSSDFSSPKTLAAQVHERIREAILHQQLKPGTRIDQNKIADDLNVSLVPVREALKSLEAEGLVSIIPRRGAFVTEVSLDHLDDLYMARQIIEGEAMYHAVPNLTEEHLHYLEALIEKMREATNAQDMQTFMEHNREFHMLIYEAIGNQHLLQIILGLWERSELYRYRFMFVMHHAENVHHEHNAIVEACRQRDQDRAKTLAMQHIQNTQKGIHQELQALLSEENT